MGVTGLQMTAGHSLTSGGQSDVKNYSLSGSDIGEVGRSTVGMIPVSKVSLFLLTLKKCF